MRGKEKSDEQPKNLLELIQQTLKEVGDSWDNVVAIWIGDHGWDYTEEPGKKITKEEAEALFSKDPPGSDYGGEECWSFHIYTKKHILLKAVYDGAEWIEVIPLDPDKPRKPEGIGGG